MLNHFPVVIISVICDAHHRDIVLQVNQQHLDWLPYSFSDHVHQNLFSIISHPSLSCLAPSLSIAFHLHCSTPFASVEKRWVSLYSYRASCNLCSDISYFSGFFVSFVYRKRYSNTKKIFYLLYSHLEPEWIHFPKIWYGILFQQFSFFLFQHESNFLKLFQFFMTSRSNSSIFL